MSATTPFTIAEQIAKLLMKLDSDDEREQAIKSLAAAFCFSCGRRHFGLTAPCQCENDE